MGVLDGLSNLFGNDKATTTGGSTWTYTGIGQDGKALTSTSMVDANGNSLFQDGSVTSATQGTTGSGGLSTYGGAMAGAELGLGLLGYFENKKTADAQRALMDQQYNTNAVHEANLQADRAHLQKVMA